VIGAGVALRVIWAFAGNGGGWDLENLGIVRATLAQSPLRVYEIVNPEAIRWPYPPGYFAWIATAGALSSATGLRFGAVVKLLPIAADAGISLLAYRALVRHGARERTALAAAALVSLGPSFAVVSAYHGQLDSVAVLPALAAVEVWERRGDRLALAAAAGALIGVGVAIKTFPIVVLLALLPTARRWTHAAAAVAGGVLVPAAVILPWMQADRPNVSFALSYRGGWGAGGLSLLVQPSLADGWFNAGSLEPSAVTRALVDAAPLLVGGALAVCVVVFTKAATEPLLAGTGIFLAGYVFGVNFFMQYVVWGMAFAVAAGFLRSSFAVQAALVPALVVTYGRRPWDADWVDVPYTIILDGLWLFCAAALVGLLIRHSHLPPPARVQPTMEGSVSRG